MLKGKAKYVNGKRNKKGKSLFVLVCLILIVVAITVAAKGNRQEVVGYIYDTGDTLWDMAVEHCPEDMDVRDFIIEIEKANGIQNSIVHRNQMYKIPVYKAKSEYLDMNTVVGYETSDEGVLLLTNDGSGYFVER